MSLTNEKLRGILIWTPYLLFVVPGHLGSGTAARLMCVKKEVTYGLHSTTNLPLYVGNHVIELQYTSNLK